jgi:hypothetical protein
MKDRGRHIIVLFSALGEVFHGSEYSSQQLPGRNSEALLAKALQPRDPKRLIFGIEGIGDPVRAK